MGPQRKRLLLSKNLLEMKFMKRTKEKTEKELEDDERKTTFANEITSAMLSHGSKFVTERSYVVCEDLAYGRLSFKGANPEIEKMMKKMNASKVPQPKVDEALLLEKDADVPVAEMMRSTSLCQTIARKFSKKNVKNRRGFKRPSDD